MALSAFDDKSKAPAPEELDAALGDAAGPWARLAARVAEAHAPITEQWNFSGAKFGWSLRLKQKERIVLYLTPQRGCFLAGVVLGEKAVTAAREAGLPEPVLALIAAAPRYAEGRGIRLTVTSPADVAAIEQLVALKMRR